MRRSKFSNVCTHHIVIISLTVDLGLPDAVRKPPESGENVKDVLLADCRNPKHHRELDAQVDTHTCTMHTVTKDIHKINFDAPTRLV